jgi:hypothetical protein
MMLVCDASWFETELLGESKSEILNLKSNTFTACNC